MFVYTKGFYLIWNPLFPLFSLGKDEPAVRQNTQSEHKEMMCSKREFRPFVGYSVSPSLTRPLSIHGFSWKIRTHHIKERP